MSILNKQIATSVIESIYSEVVELLEDGDIKLSIYWQKENAKEYISRIPPPKKIRSPTNANKKSFITEKNNTGNESSRSPYTREKVQPSKYIPISPKFDDLKENQKENSSTTTPKKASKFVARLKQEQEERERRKRLLLEAEGEMMKQEALLAEQKRKIVSEAAQQERMLQMEERLLRGERERQEKWDKIEELKRLDREKAKNKKKMGVAKPLYKRMEEHFNETFVRKEMIERRRALEELKRTKLNPTHEEILMHERNFVEQLTNSSNPQKGANLRLNQKYNNIIKQERESRMAKMREESRNKAKNERKKINSSFPQALVHSPNNKPAVLTPVRPKKLFDDKEVLLNNKHQHRKLKVVKSEKDTFYSPILPSEIKRTTLPILNQTYSKMFDKKVSNEIDISNEDIGVELTSASSTYVSSTFPLQRINNLEIRNNNLNNIIHSKNETERVNSNILNNNMPSLSPSERGELFVKENIYEVTSGDEYDVNNSNLKKEEHRLSEMYVSVMQKKIKSMEESNIKR